MVLAACGFVLSVATHVMALAGETIPGGGLVWVLHIGIFVVWIPTVLVGKRITSGANNKDFWKVALAGCPAWMRHALSIVFVYGIVNFVIFMVSTGAHAKPTGTAPPAVVRGFSGHWMIFYGAAFATLYSAIHMPHPSRDRRCPRGHSVAPTARSCPECGYVFPIE